MQVENFVPEWAKRAVWYQIFPERFWNGDPANDPTLDSQRQSWPHDLATPWQIHPWTADWYARQPYEAAHDRAIWHHLQRRRYGGDLQGILDRLDYLEDLGVNALYLNPVFQAPSAHKYDGATYHHIDPYFGPDPAGDHWLIAQETPHDPATWGWTAADRLFLQLIQAVHQRGMRLIIDGVFNHMGLNSWAFQDLVQHGQTSALRDWFKMVDWQRPTRFAPFTYSGWFGVDELPELNQDAHGLVAGPKAYIWACTRRWMDPDGDGNPGDGIDGWRLDVAFCIRHGFWKDWRRHVKAINPEAYLTAEIILSDATEPYLQGDEFDAVMNYLWAFTCAEFFVEEPRRLSVTAFERQLRQLREAYPAGVAYGLQNLLGSHDTGRIASHFVNRRALHYRDWELYCAQSRVENNPAFDTRPPTAEERSRHKLLALFQMCDVGAPMVYYGDEVGMWGANDPCCRQPMVWPELSYAPQATLPDGAPRAEPAAVAFDHDLHAYYRRLIWLRRRSPALQRGTFNPLALDDAAACLVFERCLGDERVVVAVNNAPQPHTCTLALEGVWRDALTDALYQAGAAGLTLPLPAYGGCILVRP